MSYLAELHAALVEDPLDEQLEEAVPAGPEARLAQLPVGGDELGHHGAGLLEAVDPGGAGVPVFELSVVGETGQGQEEAQLAVVLLGRTELLQAVETLDGLLHRQLQLGSRERRRLEGGPSSTFWSREGAVTYILRVFGCRHGVIHTQSFQELLFQDNVVEPGTGRLCIDIRLLPCADFASGVRLYPSFLPFLLKLLHPLQRLNELHHFLPLAIQDELPDKRSL